MTWFDWIVVGFCWSLPVVVYAVRRWRVRVYMVREIRHVISAPENEARNFTPDDGRPGDGGESGRCEPSPG